MKIESYRQPKSSFLSMEKDFMIIADYILKNQRLKKLLHYNTKDPLSQPNLTPDESYELFGKNIKAVPKLRVDQNIYNYLIIGFDNFATNGTNPEFRDNYIFFDIICHFDQWQLKDFQLRPYRIAAEIDSMFDKQHLTGIGVLQFVGAKKIVLNNEFAGISLMYKAIHGGEDKKNMPNPADNAQFIKEFNEMFNS